MAFLARNKLSYHTSQNKPRTCNKENEIIKNKRFRQIVIKAVRLLRDFIMKVKQTLQAESRSHKTSIEKAPSSFKTVSLTSQVLFIVHFHTR